ncbi:hypothetical protein BC941DRAFT_412568 [Chlamydoabsidia padenii]|nr:hypothetical protein BC941DRAFT_412568 [Chlamydoabsidia padenii]
MDQLVDKVREVETVSQGYILAPVNSVLEQPRFYQSSQTHAMQLAARRVLAPYMKSVHTLLRQTMPLTRTINLSALRGMYNVKSTSSISLDTSYDDSVAYIHSHERLDCLVYMIRSNRREWFMRLLALEMMTLGHDSARKDYEALLGVVNEMLIVMEQQTKSVLDKMTDVLNSDLYDGVGNTMDDQGTDHRSRTLLNKLASLDKHVRNLQTKIALCRHDTKGNETSYNRINDRFGTMDQDITYILAQWEESKSCLNDMTNNENRKSTPGSTLPSPPSSPGSTIRKRAFFRRSYTDANNTSSLKMPPTHLSLASSTMHLPCDATSSLSSVTLKSIPSSFTPPSPKTFQPQLLTTATDKGLSSPKHLTQYDKEIPAESNTLSHHNYTSASLFGNRHVYRSQAQQKP